MNLNKDDTTLMSCLLDENVSNLQKSIDFIAPIAKALKKCKTVKGKLDVLNRLINSEYFLNHQAMAYASSLALSSEQVLVIKSVIAIGQADKVFYIPSDLEDPLSKLRSLLDSLITVEKFYSEMGGIVGYHLLVLQFLASLNKKTVYKNIRYLSPPITNISYTNKDVMRAVVRGLQNMEAMAEIYPVGGAADRLRLQDNQTGLHLPAAKLLFCGHTLLEGLIRDLQSREYLHYKLFGKQVETPVAMMTSEEKDNHYQVISICKEQKWFGRSKDQFRFFCQTAVPTLNKNGDWCLQGPLQLLLKPGGHGVIWKLARDQGIFEWLYRANKRKALVRQINNPIAGCDYGLTAFSGIGCMEDKMLGFASCPREPGANEGINVLIEKRRTQFFEYTLTNIEYCDFKKFGLGFEGDPFYEDFSDFLSNTNILFIDLKEIEKKVAECPLPGMLINLKPSIYKNEKGEVKEEDIVRLESTMQNIADSFKEKFEHSLEPEQSRDLKTFITLNQRHKTISTVKREYVAGMSFLETPEGCFMDLLHNAWELLKENCRMEVPKVHKSSAEELRTPPFFFLYHPSLGPLYSIISQKIRCGRMAQGSELQLEIAEIDCQNLDLEGSLCVKAQQVMGHIENEILRYSQQSGKCVLKNVIVRNLGIDPNGPNVFWKNQIFRRECCRISIQGNGEFYAENVLLEGGMHIEVEPNTRVTAVQKNGMLTFQKKMISAPGWFWKYDLDENFNIILKKKIG